MRRRVRWGAVVVLVLGSYGAASHWAWSQEIAPKTLVAPPRDVNRLPSKYYAGNGPAPSRMVEVQRLGHALVDRAEALASAIWTDLRNRPGWEPLFQQAQSLVSVADDYHDGLDLNANIEIARN